MATDGAPERRVRPSRGLRAVGALGVALLVALFAATAEADNQVSTLGDVTATFSFRQPEQNQWEGLHLTIARANQVVYDQPVTVKDCVEPYCAPAGMTQRNSVRVVDLDGDRVPEVLVDLYTGGAHCCFITDVFGSTGTAYGKRTERNFADPGYRLKDLDSDGAAEFLTADYRFGYAFAAFAFSAMPVRILSWRQGTFRDVTGNYRTRIRADAALWLRRYKRASRRDEPQGIIAAWVADQYRLGKRRSALAFVRREVRSGKLRSMPNRRTFAGRLDRNLTNWGYRR